MKKKYIKEIEIEKFKIIIEQLNNIPTWTKEKHLKKEMLLDFFNSYQINIVARNKDYEKISGGYFLKWDFEIATIPEKKTGYLKKYRNKQVFILCINRGQWGKRYLLILPIKNT